MQVDVSPCVVCCSPFATGIEISLAIDLLNDRLRAAEWLLAVDVSSQGALTSTHEQEEQSPSSVMFRAKVTATGPGIVDVAAYTLDKAGSCSIDQQLQAVVPVLVAPNTAVQREMTTLFETMQHLVSEQLQITATKDSPPPDEGLARRMTWTTHFQLLLRDMQTIFNCIASKPGCLSGDAAGHVLTGVLEFLAHHGCWCTISWLLAEAFRGGLLKYAKPAAMQRLQQAQPLAWCSIADAAAAAAAGAVADFDTGSSQQESYSPQSGASAYMLCRIASQAQSVCGLSDGSSDPDNCSEYRSVAGSVGLTSDVFTSQADVEYDQQQQQQQQQGQQQEASQGPSHVFKGVILAPMLLPLLAVSAVAMVGLVLLNQQQPPGLYDGAQSAAVGAVAVPAEPDMVQLLTVLCAVVLVAFTASRVCLVA